MKSVFRTKSPEETMHLGMQLVSRFTPGTTVLLYGDLGSGKTHFTKGIAQGLGIEGIIKSPTFAYVNKYEVKSALSSELPNPSFYHYDLYRLKEGDAFNSIGLEDTLNDPHAINVIEWADRLDGFSPKDHIRVDFKNLGEEHEISIKFEDPQIVPDELVEKYWDDWTTPLHVREHCKQVAKVALQVAKGLIAKNIVLDINLINTAALLHDMSRVVDFTELDKDKIPEDISDEKWEKWKLQRSQFAGMHHGDVACGALFEDGFQKTATVIRLHDSLSLIQEPEKFSVLEIAIVYYADKRVKHTEVVDLAERYRDGRERYGEANSEEEKEVYLMVERTCYDLEKQLFGLIDMEPGDIV